jgi:hypothetical protein
MEATRLQGAEWPRWGQLVREWLEGPRLLGIILAIGIAARLCHYLRGLSFWYDEAFLLIPIYDRSALELLGALPTQTIIPPLFLWLLKGAYLLAGPGELAMRFPAFVAGLLGLVLLIPMALRIVGRPGAYWVVALGALSHHALMHGSEVRAYTVDLLATVLILWAGGAYIRGSSSPRNGRVGGGLFVLGLVGPWLSFPSVLVFGAVSMALLVDLLERGGRRRWAFWGALNVVFLISVFGVWFIQARHMYYPGLVEQWRDGWNGFAPNDSWPSVALWSVQRFVGLGEYANTGLGIPLLLLGLYGVKVVWRQSRPLAILLAGPIVITFVAALASRYPFVDRTILFLAPCVWCLAMAGLADLWRRLPSRWSLLVPAPLLLVLLTVSLAKVAADGVAPVARFEFRQALCYVHEQREPGDEALVWCQPINDVYFGHVYPGLQNPCCGEDMPSEALAEKVRGHRLWIVAPGNVIDEMAKPFRQLSMREGLRQRFFGVEIVRLDAPELENR